MPLNASGAISLGGSTVGQSIALELNRSATAQICINCTAVRTLAGVASGAIAFNNFYGKSSGPTVGVYFGGFTMPSYVVQNVATRINSCGSLIGSQTNVGTARQLVAGSPVGTNGLFYGGVQSGSICSNRVTRINSSGALVGTETLVGCAIQRPGAARIGSNGVFFGGGQVVCIGCVPQYQATCTTTRINSCGQQVGLQTAPPYTTSCLYGAGLGSVGVYYGAIWTSVQSNRVVRLNSCGVQTGTATTVGTSRRAIPSAPVSATVALFYGGFNSTTVYRISTRINACGAIVGTEQTLSSASTKTRGGGARVGSNGVFYAGQAAAAICSTPNATVTRVNACGAFVASESTVGTARSELSGAGI